MKPTTVKRIIKDINEGCGDVNVMIETKTGKTFVVCFKDGDAIGFDQLDDSIIILEISDGTKWVDMGEIMSIEI